MNFQLTEEQLAVQQAARDFAQNELLPGVIERDTHQKFPAEQIKKMGELGFMGMMVDPKYNGGGMDSISYVLAMEEISKIDASASVCMSVNNSLVCWGLEQFGTEAQKEKYLKRLATGEVIGAFCLSEPEAGSDATSQRTTAEDKGDYYLLNGTKNWITNGNSASVYIVIAQTDAEKRHKGINALIVEKGMPGFVVGKKEDKMGQRASNTVTLTFDDVEVPAENMLGEENKGFKLAMMTLDRTRPGVAAMATGIARSGFDAAVQYSKERQQFGVPIAMHQAIQFLIADMAVKVDAARLLTWQSASQLDNGERNTLTSSEAKRFAADSAMEVTTDAVQVFGGYGFIKEYQVEKFMRDAKIMQLYEGTSQIQRMVIAREVLLPRNV